MSPSSPDAALLACQNYDRALVEERAAEAFRLLGGPSSVVSPGESVFVKVNLVVPMSRTGR